MKIFTGPAAAFAAITDGACSTTMEVAHVPMPVIVPPLSLKAIPKWLLCSTKQRKQKLVTCPNQDNVNENTFTHTLQCFASPFKFCASRLQLSTGQSHIIQLLGGGKA